MWRAGIVAAIAIAVLAPLAGLWWLRSGSSWAMDDPRRCEPAPSPQSDLDAEAAWARAERVARWRDDQGCAIRADVVHAFDGAHHCDWQSVRFLWFDAGRSVDTMTAPYLRDRSGVLGTVPLLDTFAQLDAVPGGAVDSGFRRGRWALWLDPASAARVYLVRDDGLVERWPRAAQPVVCY